MRAPPSSPGLVGVCLAVRALTDGWKKVQYRTVPFPISEFQFPEIPLCDEPPQPKKTFVSRLPFFRILCGGPRKNTLGVGLIPASVACVRRGTDHGIGNDRVPKAAS